MCTNGKARADGWVLRWWASAAGDRLWELRPQSSCRVSQAATPRPHLAAAADIEAWAETIMARADLARLIRNLIRQTNDQVTTLRMPGGEGKHNSWLRRSCRRG
jgi:hypothetical protein